MGVGINGQEQSNSSQQQSSRFTFYVLRFRRNYPAIAAFLVGVLYLAGLVAMPPDAMTHHDTGA
jgi:peptidoglycan/LPS O-acetylase OafA/YrhL